MMVTLEELQSDIIIEAKKGYPILLSGSIVFLLFTFLPFILPMEAIHLIWIFGLGAIFPLGLLLGKLLGVNLLSTKNPLGIRRNRCRTPSLLYTRLYPCLYAHSRIPSLYDRPTWGIAFPSIYVDL